MDNKRKDLSMTMRNNSSQSLSEAKAAKKDEWYTQMEDISAEMRYHRKQFKDAIVLCNCDDPYESNFFKYFALNFNRLGLKKLIATCYKGSPVIATQPSWFEEIEASKELNTQLNKKAYKIEITEVTDTNGDGAIDIADVEQLLKCDKNVLTVLDGDGDFRSPECLSLLDEATIVVTNPPFSLWIPYMQLLLKKEKKFIVLGNLTGVAYKEIFPHIRDNKLWLGQSIHSGGREFRVPDDYPLKAANSRVDENGNKYIRVNVRWYTNLDPPGRHEELDLYRKYSPNEYVVYDNFDAINVDSVAEIPRDYFGYMGVPISFIDQYNPDQFEIIGMGSGNLAKQIGVQRNYRGRTDLAYTIDGVHKCPFGRMIIRRKDRKK